jgi:hypothetical protein
MSRGMLVSKMTRIRLTDEDIHYQYLADFGHKEMIIRKRPNLTNEEFEQLKKQILEDYKFREAIKVLLDTEDLNVVFDIKDKAEELDDLKKRFITTKNIVSTMETVQRNNNKLEQQNKELKDKAEYCQLHHKSYGTRQSPHKERPTLREEQLESQVKEFKDKAEKWDNYWNRPQDYRGLAELQTDNKKLESQVKELESRLEKDHQIIVHANTELGKYKQFAESVKEIDLYDIGCNNHERCTGVCDSCTIRKTLEQLIEGLK